MKVGTLCFRILVCGFVFELSVFTMLSLEKYKCRHSELRYILAFFLFFHKPQYQSLRAE